MDIKAIFPGNKESIGHGFINEKGNSTLALLILYLTSVFICALPGTSFSQRLADTIRIKEVTIIEKGLTDQTGLKYLCIDSTKLADYSSGTLSGILTEHSSVCIKSYGNGGLATTSFRGAGPSHTQVVWNGIDINSPMHGEVDFSLMPNFFLDEVDVYHGGCGISNSNGALGGTISLINLPDWNNNFNIHVIGSTGSYKSFNSGLVAGTGNKNLQSRTRITFNSTANNFWYHEVPGNEASPEYRYNNAEYSYYGIIQEIYSRLKNKNFVSAKIWFQNKDQQIPPTKFETQHEDFLRTVLELKAYENRFDYTLRSAFMNNYLNYRNFKDSVSPINSKNQVYTFTNFADFNYYAGHNTNIFFSANFDFHRVQSNNYDEDKERKNLSVSGGVKRTFFERLQILAIIKQEISDSRFIPLIPSLGIEYRIKPNHDLYLKANIAKNYHTPTLNDLYWKDDGFSYGNPGLEPEEGYSGEMGLLLRNNKSFDSGYSFEVTGFYSLINKWFMWHPDQNGKWYPQNLRKVARRGLEATSSVNFIAGDFLVVLDNNYNLTISTNLKAAGENDNSVGKQLIYVPVHTANSSLKISNHGYFIRYSFHYYGKRYTSSDNEMSLPAFAVNNLLLGKKLVTGRSRIAFHIAIDNIFGKEYQLTQGYPMPGRYFRLGAEYSFDK